MVIKQTLSDALWMSLLAGLGGVAIVAVILGGFYFFDPVGKMIIEDHSLYVLITFLIIFVAGFGLSLQVTLQSQFRRGKWD